MFAGLPPGAIPLQLTNGRAPVGPLLMTPAGLVQLQPMVVGGAARGRGAPSPGPVEPVRSVLDLPDDVDVMEGERALWRG